jgi:hypothetical protein
MKEKLVAIQARVGEAIYAKISAATHKLSARHSLHQRNRS